MAKINPVKLTESAFPMSLLDMSETFRSIAMGVETPDFSLKPNMLAFLKELEPMFRALPVKKFGSQALKQEFEASVQTPELKKELLVNEHQSRHLLLCCVVITSCIAFFMNRGATPFLHQQVSSRRVPK